MTDNAATDAHPPNSPSGAAVRSGSMWSKQPDLSISRLDTLTLLYELLPSGLAASLACSIALTIVEWQSAPPALLLGWLAFMAAVAAGRAWTAAAFQRLSRERDAAPERNASRWSLAFYAGTVLAGCGWGTTALVFPADAEPIRELFLIFVLGGISAGASATLAPSIAAFLCFVLPIIGSLVLRLSTGGGPQAGWMLVYLLLYFSLLTIVVRRQSTVLHRNLALTREYAALAGQFESLVDHIPNMIFVKDARTLRFVHLNKAGEDLLGLPRDTFLGKTDFDVFPPEQATFFTDRDREALATGTRPVVVEEPIKTDGKGLRWLRTKKVPLFDVSGAPQYLLGISEDITDSRLAEEEERSRQERLEQLVVQRTEELRSAYDRLERTAAHGRTVIAASPIAIIALDRDGCVTSWNRAAVQIFGWTEDDVLGRELPYCRPDQEQDSEHLWPDVMAGGAVQGLEVRRWRKDGTPVDLLFWAVRLNGSSTERCDSIGFFLDLSDRKKLEQQFRQAQKMQAIGRLAGGIAHDFNNLLTVITGYNDLLLEQLDQRNPHRPLVLESQQAAQRAADLTRQLLTFSRQDIVRPQALDLNAALQSFNTMLKRLVQETVRLSLDLDPALWPIYGDRRQLDQVVLNLVVNAKDAMPDGGTLTIATRNVPEKRGVIDPPAVLPGDAVRLSVTDTGGGMAPEIVASIFEPFFTTKEEKGTGLGLATVYGIVTQHKGQIRVESEPGRGSSFHVYLPRHHSAPLPDQPSGPAARSGSEVILVVEDQEEVRRLVVAALTGFGYQVREAGSGDEALRMAAQWEEPPQAVVSDVVMPQMSGLVFVERLRRVWPGLKVLFMSGYTQQAPLDGLEQAGTSFIHKPFSPMDLATQVRALLDRPAEEGKGHEKRQGT